MLVFITSESFKYFQYKNCFGWMPSIIAEIHRIFMLFICINLWSVFILQIKRFKRLVRIGLMTLRWIYWYKLQKIIRPINLRRNIGHCTLGKYNWLELFKSCGRNFIILSLSLLIWNNNCSYFCQTGTMSRTLSLWFQK